MKTSVFHGREAGVVGSATGHDRFFRSSVVVARALTALSSKVDVPNAVELPTDRPVLFAANHASLYDLISSLVALGRYDLPSRIGVNARFFTNPVAGAILRNMGCIPFSSAARVEAENAMVAALEQGQACAIMPEGRIVRRHERVDGVGPGRLGVSRIARRAGAAVVPVGFAGADRAWPPGRPVMRVGLRRPQVKLALGTPLSFESDDHDHNVSTLMAAISALVLAGEATSTEVG